MDFRVFMLTDRQGHPRQQIAKLFVSLFFRMDEPVPQGLLTTLAPSGKSNADKYL